MSTISYRCTGLATAVSVVLGVLTAVFLYTGLIAVTPVFLWVAFGIAVAALGALYVLAAQPGRSRAVCAQSRILAGSLGTILTALILLAFGFAATSVVGAIVAGFLGFFFSLLITATACGINCLTGFGD